MRKIFVLLFLLSALPVAAEGIFNLGIGPAFPVGDTGQPIIEGWGLPNVKWGGLGANLDLQYLHEINKKLYLGPEIGVSFFSHKTQKYSVGPYSVGETVTDSNTFYLMLAGRFYPDSPTSRFYIPFGLGLQRTAISILPRIGTHSLDTIHASDIAPGGYVGLGVELRREPDDLISIELRYNISYLKDNVYGENIEATYRAVSLLLKMGGTH